jgi:creatinine amidohydrolase
MLAVHTSWGRFGYPDGLFGDAERTHGIHGGDIETSIMLAAYPDLVRRDKIANFTPATVAMERDYKHLRADFPVGFGWMTQDLNASGAMAMPRSQRPRRARQRSTTGHGVLELLRDVERFELPVMRHASEAVQSALLRVLLVPLSRGERNADLRCNI